MMFSVFGGALCYGNLLVTVAVINIASSM